MFIRCPGCGEKQLLDTRRQCQLCNQVLRRCVDCANYKAFGHHCKILNTKIEAHEAERPGPLAVSALCRDYKPIAIAA